MLTKGLPGNSYLAQGMAKNFSMDVGGRGGTRLQDTMALGSLIDAGSPVLVKPSA